MKNYAGEYLYYLPWYDKENVTFVDMARAIELSFRFLEKQQKVVERNLFIETAIEALPIYQRDLGLQISEEVSLEQRRKIIQGYLHYLHEQTTEEVVRELLKSFENERNTIDISKSVKVDTYEIMLIFTEKTSHNSLDLINMLERVLPAHLVFVFNLLLNNKLVLKDKTDNHLTRHYFTGDHNTGTVPKHQYTGVMVRESVNIPNTNNAIEQRTFNVNEISSGGDSR